MSVSITTNTLIIPAAADPRERMIAENAGQQRAMVQTMQAAMDALQKNLTAKTQAVETVTKTNEDLQAELAAAEARIQQQDQVHAAAMKALIDKHKAEKANVQTEIVKAREQCVSIDKRLKNIAVLYNVGMKQAENRQFSQEQIVIDAFTGGQYLNQLKEGGRQQVRAQRLNSLDAFSQQIPQQMGLAINRLNAAEAITKAP
jgi:hypothetical protein